MSSSAFPGAVIIDAWRQHEWLCAGFSTRLDGKSGVYGVGDLNLGFTQSDDPATVFRNRERFLGALGVSSVAQLVTVRQFHSNLVRQVGESSDSVPSVEDYSRLRGDGLITKNVGLTLGIQTADCVPVLVADVRQRVVGAFHAGWRGTLRRIVQHGIGDFISSYGSRPQDLIAAIGPCIGACCFKVGKEVRDEFESQFLYGNKLFLTADSTNAMSRKHQLLFGRTSFAEHADEEVKLRMDLVEANRTQLIDSGLSESRIVAVGECTACTLTENGRRKYFSHRAEQGFTGRMLNVIGIAHD